MPVVDDMHRLLFVGLALAAVGCAASPAPQAPTGLATTTTTCGERYELRSDASTVEGFAGDDASMVIVTRQAPKARCSAAMVRATGARLHQLD
jgi:hypothetical protein